MVTILKNDGDVLETNLVREFHEMISKGNLIALASGDDVCCVASKLTRPRKRTE
jgi:hypothetical protein